MWECQHVALWVHEPTLDLPGQPHDHEIICASQVQSRSGSYYDSAGTQRWWILTWVEPQLPVGLTAVHPDVGCQENREDHLAGAVTGLQEHVVILGGLHHDRHNRKEFWLKRVSQHGSQLE